MARPPLLCEEGNALTHPSPWSRCSASQSPQLIGTGPRGRHVGSDGCGIAVEIAIEPVHLPLETFDQMGGFAGPSEIVIFSREKDNFAWHAIMLERAEPLLALFDGDAEIHVGMHDERGCLDVLYVFQWRPIPIGFKSIEYVPAEVVGVAILAVTGSLITDEIRKAAQRDSGFEAGRVAEDPIREKAAIAAAGHAEAIPINPGILRQYGIQAVHDIHVIFAAPLPLDASFKFFPVSCGASRIRKEHGPTARSVDLVFVIPVKAEHPCGPAVDAQHHRIFLSGFPTGRLHQKSVHIPAIGAFERHSFYR